MHARYEGQFVLANDFSKDLAASAKCMEHWTRMQGAQLHTTRCRLPARPTLFHKRSKRKATARGQAWGGGDIEPCKSICRSV